MMKKPGLLVFLLFWASSLCADGKPVVAVCPLKKPTDQGWIDNLGNTVEDVVFLTLALMGHYEIVRPHQAPEDLSDEGLLEFARAGNLDDIIFGECLTTDEGYRFSVSIFDHYKGGVTVHAEENFESLMDSFDAADLLAEALVEGLSGVKVRYGGLSLALSRDEPYRTEINSVDMGEGFSGSDRLITGSHTLEFFQDRGKGEIMVSRRELEIKEDESVNLESPIPWLTEDEEAFFRELDWSIARLGDDRNRAALAEELLEQGSSRTGNEFYSSYRSGLQQRYEDWKAYYARPIYEGPGSEPQEISRITDNRLYRFRQRSPAPLIGSELGEGTARLSRLFNSEPDRGDIILPAMATITVDGRADDWEGLPAIIQDPIGDLGRSLYLKQNHEQFEGQDIEWVGVAMDEERLYMAIKTQSGKLSRKRSYRVNLGMMSRMVIIFEPGKNKTHIVELFTGSWDGIQRSYKSSEYQVRYAYNDIVEYSVPLHRIFSFVDTSVWTMRISYDIDRISDPWYTIDSSGFYVFIPHFYYRLR